MIDLEPKALVVVIRYLEFMLTPILQYPHRQMGLVIFNGTTIAVGPGPGSLLLNKSSTL